MKCKFLYNPIFNEDGILLKICKNRILWRYQSIPNYGCLAAECVQLQPLLLMTSGNFIKSSFWPRPLLNRQLPMVFDPKPQLTSHYLNFTYLVSLCWFLTWSQKLPIRHPLMILVKVKLSRLTYCHALPVTCCLTSWNLPPMRIYIHRYIFKCIFLIKTMIN